MIILTAHCYRWRLNSVNYHHHNRMVLVIARIIFLVFDEFP